MDHAHANESDLLAQGASAICGAAKNQTRPTLSSNMAGGSLASNDPMPWSGCSATFSSTAAELQNLGGKKC